MASVVAARSSVTAGQRSGRTTVARTPASTPPTVTPHSSTTARGRRSLTPGQPTAPSRARGATRPAALPPVVGGADVASPSVERGDRWRALVASTVVVVAVAIPGVRTLVDDDAPDGFPLSTYPMFSRDRGRVVELPTVVADGPSAASALCREVAARLAHRSPSATEVRPGTDPAQVGPAAVASVQVVVERHDAITWSAGRREPLDRRTVATCEAP